MKGHGTKLTRKQEQAIAALLTCQTIAAAANTAGIGEATLFRWLQLDDFQKAYRSARWQAVSQAITQIQSATSGAVATLCEIAGDRNAPATTRVTAAKSILDLALKAIEVEDMAARISLLEKRVEEADSV